MKSLYNVTATTPNPFPNTKKIEPAPEVHIGLYDNTTMLETGVTAFLFKQITADEWHQNNSVIVPPISDSLFITESQIEVPAAAAVWQEDIRFWTYRNFVIRISVIPLLVSSQDVMNYIEGRPLTAAK